MNPLAQIFEVGLLVIPPTLPQSSLPIPEPSRNGVQLGLPRLHLLPVSAIVLTIVPDDRVSLRSHFVLFRSSLKYWSNG